MFRQKAIDAHKTRLHGDVFVVQPVSYDWIITIVLLIFTFSLLILFLGSYAYTENVKGQIIPSKGLLRVKSINGGTLNNLFVKEGDLIKKGEPLLRVTLEKEISGGNTYSEQVSLVLDNREKKIKELILLAESKALEDKKEVNIKISENNNNLSLINQRIALQKELIATSEKKYKRLEKYVERGVISRIDYEEYYEGYLKNKALDKDLQLRKVELATISEELLIQLQQVDIESKKSIAELSNTLSSIKKERADLQKQNVEVISSPINARVISIPTKSIGSPIDKNQSVVILVPEGSEYEVELFVPTRAIGLVENNQQVKVFYDAFPYQIYGSYTATINEISETVLLPNEVSQTTGLKEPMYRVIAKLEKQNILIDGKHLSLHPGMTLRGNIVLERRSFVDWILKPLRGLKERS